MLKKFLTFIAVVAMAGALGLGFLSLYLDKAIKNGVERLGPKLTGTTVRLAGVAISPLSGRGEITGLTIGNPPGFRTDAAIRIGKLRLAVVPCSLLSDRIEIKRIVINNPEITLEKTLHGSNLDRIMANIQDFTGTAGRAAPAKPGSGRQLIIDDLLITNGTVRLSATVLEGRAVTVPLPTIHLREIGRKSGGASPGEVTREAFAAVAHQVKNAVAASAGGAKKVVTTLGSRAREGVRGFIREVESILPGGKR